MLILHGKYRDEDVLIVLLLKENVERIQKYDPCEIPTGALSLKWTRLVIGYVKPEDEERVTEWSLKNDVTSILTLVESGFLVEGTDGDGVKALHVGASGGYIN